MQNQMSDQSFYYYISSRAACDPVPTIYLCAPEKDAVSWESVRRFAVESGWQSIAEEKGAVLAAPVAEHGWEQEPVSLLFDLYTATKNDFKSRSGSAIWGRSGSLWCWETLLYVAGYQEGARFAGNFLSAYPGFAAAAALVDGLPDDFSRGDQASHHWMVRSVSEDYSVRNREIPVCLWLFGTSPEAAADTAAYFAGGAQPVPQEVAGAKTLVWPHPLDPAGEVRLAAGEFAGEEERSRFIFREEFSHVIRWKSGPDGRLARIRNREEFYADPRFIRHTVERNGISYDFFVRLPAGKTAGEVKGLPVVFTVHGRGEPAWLFTTKNGWDALADETGEFVLVSPDSPGNIWFLFRDGDAFEAIIQELSRKYGIDTERIYLTGFSNGAVMTRELAWTRPWLFAAVSPSNGPWFDTYSMQLTDTSRPPEAVSPEVTDCIRRFREEGWEMPCAFFFGDSDPAASPEQNPALLPMLEANHCDAGSIERYDGENYFTPERGYREGERFRTEVYRDGEGAPRVCVTVMKNMPHGAISEESRFAWEFLKRFRRRAGEKKVLFVKE